jgi:hypothetical protein
VKVVVTAGDIAETRDLILQLGCNVASVVPEGLAWGESLCPKEELDEVGKAE